MKPTRGAAASFPLKLTVQPFKLESVLLYSFGMFYDAVGPRPVIAGQLQFMREIGFTAAETEGITVSGINADSVEVKIDPGIYELAKTSGFGKAPDQYGIAGALGQLRVIGRRLGHKLDANPGCEMDDPKMKSLAMA